jgi:hypothetical protein
MNSDKPSGRDERRNDLRQLRKESVSIQLVFPSEDGLCKPEVAAVVTIDVSQHGLHLLLDRPLEAGRIFDLCIELADEPRRFLLTGETRWCHAVRQADAQYEVGIQILDGEGTDFDAWARFFDQRKQQRQLS